MVSFPRAGFVRIALVPKPMAAAVAVAVVEVINVLRFIFGFNSSVVRGARFPEQLISTVKNVHPGHRTSGQSSWGVAYTELIG
jgi:hypothetical protein